MKYKNVTCSSRLGNDDAKCLHVFSFVLTNKLCILFIYLFQELRSDEQVEEECDDADRLLWEDEDTASPYFQSSCSTSEGGTQRRKTAYKRTTKRRVRRKKRSPT